VSAVKQSPVAPLRKDREFRRAYRRGYSKSAAGVVVHVFRRRGAPDLLTRVGVSVSTKVGNAVVRNKIKRRLKEICRLRKGALTPGCDVVIVARTKAAEYTYSQIERDLLYLFNKLGVMKRE